MKKNLIFEASGIWLLLASIFDFSPSFVMYNYIAVGFVCVVCAMNFRKEPLQKRIFVGGIGFWLIIAAYVPKLLLHPFSQWNGIIFGLLLFYLGYKIAGKPRKGELIQIKQQ